MKLVNLLEEETPRQLALRFQQDMIDKDWEAALASKGAKQYVKVSKPGQKPRTVHVGMDPFVGETTLWVNVKGETIFFNSAAQFIQMNSENFR
jgi:hypothetical protein